MYRVVLVCGAVLLLIGTAFLDRPPVAHTGGFGEPTCYQCHFDGDLNAPGGALALQGLPARYVAGQVYPLAVSLSRADLERGGFQMAVRFAGGPDEGRQAGAFSGGEKRIAFEMAGEVQYVSHTKDGALPAAPDSIRWTVDWKAPESAPGPIVFHLVGNAANGDDSQFGDYVYTLEVKSQAK